MKLTILLLLPVALVLHFCQGRPQANKNIQNLQQKHVGNSNGFDFRYATSNGITNCSIISELKPVVISEEVSKSNSTAQLETEYHEHVMTDEHSDKPHITTTQLTPKLAEQKLKIEGELDDRIGTALLASTIG